MKWHWNEAELVESRTLNLLELSLYELPYSPTIATRRCFFAMRDAVDQMETKNYLLDKCFLTLAQRF